MMADCLFDMNSCIIVTIVSIAFQQHEVSSKSVMESKEKFSSFYCGLNDQEVTDFEKCYDGSVSC